MVTLIIRTYGWKLIHKARLQRKNVKLFLRAARCLLSFHKLEPEDYIHLQAK
jgi:hypothetical protein